MGRTGRSNCVTCSTCRPQPTAAQSVRWAVDLDSRLVPQQTAIVQTNRTTPTNWKTVPTPCVNARGGGGGGGGGRDGVEEWSSGGGAWGGTPQLYHSTAPTFHHLNRRLITAGSAGIRRRPPAAPPRAA